ncbi:hypothetical protein ILUMI_01222 [Ignelater luminosus]|uniref:Uncharacterized protein n=1 Tax=Ignelater luminosus TaxID=2038154 RepID=A0A8K0DIX6_IGNLU|nr:hypothetical protein ILUMI_01222 [Ignelater luminosus]
MIDALPTGGKRNYSRMVQILVNFVLERHNLKDLTGEQIRGLQRTKHATWLQQEFVLPQSLDQKTSRSAGRPTNEFVENSYRTNLRKTENIRHQFSSKELAFSTHRSLKAPGATEAKTVLKEVLSRIYKLFFRSSSLKKPVNNFGCEFDGRVARKEKGSAKTLLIPVGVIGYSRVSSGHDTISITRGRRIYFVVDNIDFLENTPNGKGTLHGTVITVYQERLPPDQTATLDLSRVERKDRSLKTLPDSLLGELHIIMAQLPAIGSFINGTKFPDMWSETNIYKNRTIREILDGGNVRRATEPHTFTTVALYNCYFKAFFQLNLGLLKSSPAKLYTLQKVLQTNNTDCISNAHRELIFELERLGLPEEMEKFDSEMGSGKPNFKVIRQYMEMVEKSALGADEALEDENRSIKIAVDPTGITQNPKALNCFFLSSPELAGISADGTEMFNVASSKGETHHALNIVSEDEYLPDSDSDSENLEPDSGDDSDSSRDLPLA